MLDTWNDSKTKLKSKNHDPTLSFKDIMNKCEITENNMKIKMYETIWCRLYTEVRREKRINEESGKGSWKSVTSWVWKRSLISFKTTTTTSCVYRTGNNQITENRVNREEWIELSQIMRVFDSQPEKYNSDTWGNMETSKIFCRECCDKSV